MKTNHELWVLDLFSGTGSATKPFWNAGYRVITLDIRPECKADLQMSIEQFYGHVVIKEDDLIESLYGLKLENCLFIWASPDCKLFSIANHQLSKHWWKGHPYSPEVLEKLRDVSMALAIIDKINPRYWVLENPRGMLRTVPMMDRYARRTVTYCQYSDVAPAPRMKPTDLWGRLPVTWRPKMCHNGDDCHVATPRESTKGTEAMSYDERIQVPYKLGEEILQHCEAMKWSPMDVKTLFDFESE